MATVTQRMLTTQFSTNSTNYVVLWGEAEDGVLNGGTSLCASIENKGANALTVQILVQATADAKFVANTSSYTCPAGVVTRIDITGLVGYAARLQGKLAAGTTGIADIAVQVQS